MGHKGEPDKQARGRERRVVEPDGAVGSGRCAWDAPQRSSGRGGVARRTPASPSGCVNRTRLLETVGRAGGAVGNTAARQGGRTSVVWSVCGVGVVRSGRWLRGRVGLSGRRLVFVPEECRGKVRGRSKRNASGPDGRSKVRSQKGKGAIEKHKKTHNKWSRSLC